MTIIIGAYGFYSIPYVVKNMVKSEERKLYELEIIVKQERLKKELNTIYKEAKK